MAELTTEYLDKKLEALTTNFDKKLEGLATKADLENQTKDLKTHAESLQAELAGMIERSVNVSERVEKLESDIRAIKPVLHLS